MKHEIRFGDCIYAEALYTTALSAPAMVIQGHSQTLESSLSTAQTSLSRLRCSNQRPFPALGTSLFWTRWSTTCWTLHGDQQSTSQSTDSLTRSLDPLNFLIYSYNRVELRPMWLYNNSIHALTGINFPSLVYFINWHSQLGHNYRLFAFKSNQIKFIKQKDHEATYIASNKQQLAINFTVHKNIVLHLHKINFTKIN